MFATSSTDYSRQPRRPYQQPNESQSGVAVAYFYREGDQRFAPQRVVVNRRRYTSVDALKNELSDKIQLPRGVRTIFTPRGKIFD